MLFTKVIKASEPGQGERVHFRKVVGAAVELGADCPRCGNWVAKAARACAVCKQVPDVEATRTGFTHAGDEGPDASIACRACKQILSEADRRAKRCSSCGTEIADDADVAGGLYAKGATCPGCGAPLKDGKPYCPGCGASVSKSRSSAKVQLSPETRNLLVLQEYGGPEAVRQAIRENPEVYAAHVAEVVAGGTVAAEKAVRKSKQPIASAIIAHAHELQAVMKSAGVSLTWPEALDRAIRAAGPEAYAHHRASFLADCS